MTSGVSAGYVGEMRKAKASKPAFGNLHLSSKKLMCKVLISNDLIRSNAYGADQLILNDATTAMALAMDKAALLGSGTEFEPLGLLKMSNIPSININAAPDAALTGVSVTGAVNDLLPADTVVMSVGSRSVRGLADKLAALGFSDHASGG